MDMVTMFLVLTEVEKDTAAGYDQAAAYYIGDASEQSAATFGRAQKRGADYGMLNGNGAAFINVEIIGALTSGKASASSIATTTSAAYVKIEAYYKLLYTQATLKYAHSIDEAIEHEDAVEMAEMIGEGYAFWRTLRPWVKAWDSDKAAIIDDIYDTSRAPRGEPYTVQGSNYYTYCHVKKILDEFVETLPSGVQANYGTYDEADDVECLKSGSDGSVAYADSSTITDHDDLFMETGIGNITVAGLTYTPSSNVGASLYFSEAVKKTLQHNSETGSAAAVLADYHSFGLEGIADRAKLGHEWAKFSGADYGHDSATWISDILDEASQLTHTGSRLELFEKTIQDTLAVQAIMEDLARAVDGNTSYTDVSGNALPSRGYSNDTKTNYWDHAFAKFIGTENARSKTIYARANKRGANYGQNDNNGVSAAAKSIIQDFIDGQSNAANRPALYSDIEHTIQVIYAQATLRYAYLVDRDLADGHAYEEHQAEGLAFYNTISAWVKKSSAAGAGVEGDAIVRNFFDVNTVPESYNYYSFCAVKKVMVAFLGSSASQMGTLEDTNGIDCTSIPGGTAAINTVAGSYTPTADVGGSTSFTVAMKSTIDEIDVGEGTPDYSGAKAKFAALGIQGAADEIRTVEPYWELARAYFGTDNWMSAYFNAAADTASYGQAARIEMMEKTARDAVAVMAIISDAYKGSKGTTDVHDRYWDHAAAKFLGTDATRGVTVFNRAQKRAANYGTLEGADAAKANSLIITALKLGKDATTTQARLAQYDAVVSQMKVIYSQCVLRYAYLVDQDIATGADYTEHQAEGQAFWRVIAPWVNAVDENGAVYLEGIFNLARAPTHSNHFCHTKEILGLMGVTSRDMGTLEGTERINCEGVSAPENAHEYFANGGDVVSAASARITTLFGVCIAALVAVFA